MKAPVEFESLGELPTGWRWQQLQDLAADPRQDIVDGPFGSNLKASEYADEGVPIARLQNVDRNQFIDKNIRCVTQAKADELARHQFQPGDILLTKLGDPLGKACIVPPAIGRGVVVADLVRIRPDLGRVERKYLTYALNSPAVIRQLGRHTKGTTRPRVNLGVVRRLLIPVAPRDEQESVVAEIEKQFSRLDEAVASLKRVKANLKRYKASVLWAAFDFAGAVETLSDVADAIVDCPHSTPTWTPSGFICVRTSDFRPGNLDLRSPRYVSKETFDRRNARLVPREGDILYSREGGILGIACVVPRNVNLCLGQRMLLVRPGSRVRSRYVMHWLNSPQTLMRVRVLTGGSASPHLNLRDVRAFHLPVPTLTEQDRIVEDIDRRLTIAEAMEGGMAACELRCEALRQAHLNRLLPDQ